MAALAGSVLIVDLVLLVTLLEAAALVLYHRRTGRGPSPARLLPMLGAGLFLMLGLRAVLAGAPWPWLPLCLAAAGVVHVLDLRARWRG